MPSFCRHNRFVENCPICRTKEQPRPARSSPRRATAPRTAGARRSLRAASNLTVRRVERAADDGFDNELVPGVRATEDARRLAAELAFSAARLEALSADPPELYGEIAAQSDAEEAIWLTFLVAYLSPLADDDPFAGIRAARTPWATGELPALDDVPLGPRSSHAMARGSATLTAYRSWAGRAGSQAAALAGEPGWTPQRRFDRAFERLALPGLSRAARYEFLVLAGALGIVDVEASSVQLGGESDATVLAAKRVFGIGDAINLQRRAAELATAAGVPIAALDLALVNWARPEGERITAGVSAGTEQADRIEAVLGVPAHSAAAE